MRLAFAAVLSLAAASEPLSAACDQMDADVYTAAASDVQRDIGRAEPLPVFVHPWTSPVTSVGVEQIVSRWEWGKEVSPLPKLGASPAYKALLKVGGLKRQVPKLRGVNIEVRPALDEALGCNPADPESSPVRIGIDFSPVGYTADCAAAAVLVYTRTCLSESYEILELKRAKDWTVTWTHTLYVRGE